MRRLRSSQPDPAGSGPGRSGGPEPGANFDYAAPFTEIMLLGLIAANHGGKLEWDSKKMRITNRPELNMYLKDPVRKGWECGDELWKG